MMFSQLINSAGLCRHSKFDHDFAACASAIRLLHFNTHGILRRGFAVTLSKVHMDTCQPWAFLVNLAPPGA